MNSKAKLIALSLAVVGASLSLALSAGAAVVPNMFQRSCHMWGCSQYKQTNGPYKAAYPSRCLTYYGNGPYVYYNPPGRPCR